MKNLITLLLLIAASTTQANTIILDSISAKAIRADAFYGAVPIGTIVMWTGNINDLPSCWTEVPELRGRFPVGVGQASNLSIGDVNPTYTVGSTTSNAGDGRNQITLTEPQMPSHSHSFRNIQPAIAGQWKSDDSGRNNIVDDGNVGHSGHIASTGGNQPHENRPPFYGVYFIKKTSNNCPN